MMVLEHLPVFAEPVILDVKQPVFDFPMSPQQGQGAVWRQVGQAAHSVLHAVSFPTSQVVPYHLMHSDHASQAGEIGIGCQFLRHPHLPPLSPTVALTHRAVLRGPRVGE